MKSHARARLVHMAITAATASVLSWATLLAQPRTVAGKSADAPVAARAITHASGWAVVTGRAWHADDTPIASARLRLRTVTTGKIAATTVSNTSGEFTFIDMPAGTYIVELLSNGGKIRGISGVVAVARGESVATFVRETTRASSFRALFTNAAAAVSSAAASTGITALSPDAMRPASPQK
jgi:hypothetical protein